MYNKPPDLSQEFADHIKAAAYRFEDEASCASFIVYAILDPLRRDHSRRYAGLPIYVGETKSAADRLQGHMRFSTSETQRQLPIKVKLQRIVALGHMPTFIVLEKCQTRSESLEAELRWSQLLLKQGYELFNSHPGQSRVVNRRHYKKLIANRLWKLTFKEAIDEGAAASIICPNGCFHIQIDLDQHANGEGSHARLGRLKGLVERCELCQSRAALELRLPNGSRASWQLPSYEKCKKRERPELANH